MSLRLAEASAQELSRFMLASGVIHALLRTRGILVEGMPKPSQQAAGFRDWLGAALQRLSASTEKPRLFGLSRIFGRKDFGFDQPQLGTLSES